MTRLTGFIKAPPHIGPVLLRIVKDPKTARPDMRESLFKESFYDISKRYGGESRKVRRAMARDLSKRRRKQMKGSS